MDILSLLMNAKITNIEGDGVAEVFGVSITGGKMTIIVDNSDETYYEDDPDGGEEVDDEDDEEELDPTKETGNVEPLRAIVGGRG